MIPFFARAGTAAYNKRDLPQEEVHLLDTRHFVGEMNIEEQRGVDSGAFEEA